MVNKPNVILIVLDTMRKDAIGAYGGGSNTPAIDNFARDAVVFNNCVSPAPWTTPSHASLFTGEYPLEHGVHESKDTKCINLKKTMNSVATETLPEYMQRRASYNTVGFSANYFVCPGSGFERGFDVFNYVDARGIEDTETKVIDKELGTLNGSRRQIAWDLFRRGEVRKLAKLYLTYRRIKKRQESLRYPQSKGGNVIVQNIRDSKLDDPFFLFANLMEMHEPYVKYEMDSWSFSLEDLFGLKSIPQDVLNEMRLNYCAAARRTDSLFGRLMLDLKAKNLYDQSLILVLSDHGQAFREKNYYGHGLFLHDEIIEVPLLVKFPNNQKFPVRSGYQSLVDIPDLIKSVVEVGRSSYTTDTLTKEYAYSESFGIHYQFIPRSGRETHEVQRKAIYKKGYKLVVNMADDGIEEFTYLKKPLDHMKIKPEVESLLSELRASGRVAAELPISSTSAPFAEEEELVILERLHALGYS